MFAEPVAGNLNGNKLPLLLGQAAAAAIFHWQSHGQDCLLFVAFDSSPETSIKIQ